MKKRLLFAVLLVISAVVLFSFASCDFWEQLTENPFFSPLPEEEHTHAWVWTTDADTHLGTCACGEVTEAEAHVPVTDPGTEATCGDDGITEGSHCEICACVIVAQEPIPATGEHDATPCDFLLPTFTEDGCVSGEICRNCGTVTTGDEDRLPAIENTCGTYAYDALASQPNGAEMQSFYSDVYDACVRFHTSDTLTAKLDSNQRWLAFSVPYDTYGLSSNEVFAVLECIQNDCPVFYWIHNYRAADERNLKIFTSEAYAAGTDRTALNNVVYRGIASLGYRTGTAYELAFFLHDTLIDTLDYAYEADGETPSSAVWAHNILGYFQYKTGVCETYAETFILFLNYWGVDNTLVTGNAGGVGHAWNMVKMDNDDWYWFDLTWDDQPGYDLGRIYNYFCKTDDEFSIMERFVDETLYDIPEAGTASYTGNLPAMGTSFTSGGFTYHIVGYDEVELTSASGFGAVTVPARVTYQGRTYAVVSVGKLEGGYLMNVFGSAVTSVSLPKTIRHIRGNAFNTSRLTSVSIAADNPYLFVEGGTAIYRYSGESACTLVCYLSAPRETTLILRDDCIGIESWSFINEYVTEVVLPAELCFIDDNAFNNCNRAISITYLGTMEDWQAVTIGISALPECDVACSDGTLSTQS